MTASQDRPVSEVTRDLQARGFTVDRVFAELRIVTGVAEESALAVLRAIDGVASIEPDQPIDIGPPESPETW